MSRGGLSRLRHRIVLVISFALILQGCAGPAVKLVPSITGEKPPGLEEGVVVVRVVNASGYPLPFNYLTITPENVNQSQQIKPLRLESANKVVGQNDYFVSGVPKGRYSVSNILSFYRHGDWIYRRWASANMTLGTFDVKPGVVTDLGTIIYYPKMQGDKYIDSFSRIPGSDNRRLVKNYFDFIPYDRSTPLSWNERTMDQDHRSSYLSMVQNPLVYNKRMKAADGTIYFVGKLGAIFSRAPSGKWAFDAVDADVDLLTVAVSDTGDLAVGGDHGTLYVKPAGGVWQNHSVGVEYAVEEVIFNPSGTVDAVVRNHRELKIIRSSSLDADADWRTMGSYGPYAGWFDSAGKQYIAGAPKSKSIHSYKRIGDVSLKTRDARPYLAITLRNGTAYSPFDSSTRHLYRFESDNWVVQQYDDEAAEMDATVDAGAVQLGIKEPNIFSVTPYDRYYRHDLESGDWVRISTEVDRCPSLGSTVSRFCKRGGETILRKPPFEFQGTPVFSSNLEAVGIVRYVEPEGMRYGRRAEDDDADTWVLVTTDDGGANWSVSEGKLPRDYCGHTIPEAGNTLLVYCYGISSDAWESDDQGMTWRHVRQHESF